MVDTRFFAKPFGFIDKQCGLMFTAIGILDGPLKRTPGVRT
jgi:hypothetical protein